MIRLVAAAFAAVLAGLPLLLLPSWPIAVVAGTAASLCGVGIGARSIPWVTAGAVLALIEYASALWLAAARPNFLGAAVFGLALVLLLDLVDFAGRVHDVALGRGVIAGHVRHWLATCAAAVAIMSALGAVTLALTVALPPPASSALTAAGALLTFAGASGALRVAMRRR